jgi:hypothetical protein
MPLEIRELIIKARIDTEPRSPLPWPAESFRELKEQVLQEVLERLQQLLAEKQER